MREWNRSFAAAVVAVVVLVACSACEPGETAPTPATTTGAGADQPYDGGSGGADADADADASVDPDAGASPVLLGLTPTPRGTGGGEPTPVDVLEAELATYAVGVRAVVVARRWDELDAAAVDELVVKVAGYRAKDLAVVLDLLVVDRYGDCRPVPVEGLAWDHPATLSAMQDTLDALLPPIGAELHALAFGRETDRYVEAHPGEAAALTQLFQHAMTHARGIQATLPTAVGLSWVGDSPPSPYQTLLDLGQVLLLSYLPGLGEPQLPADTSPTHDLDVMIALAGGKPVSLLAAGTTSNAALGSTPDEQQQFLTALFGALAARRARFELVNVHQLHDLTPSACEVYAASHGETPDGPFAQYMCESGLRSFDGTPKPAWNAFIEGAAAFASP